MFLSDNLSTICYSLNIIIIHKGGKVEWTLIEANIKNRENLECVQRMLLFWFVQVWWSHYVGVSPDRPPPAKIMHCQLFSRFFLSHICLNFCGEFIGVNYLKVERLQCLKYDIYIANILTGW